MEDRMLTTLDNPFNPFTDFVRWWKEDLRLGHDTCGFLARKADTCELYSDEVNEAEVYRAMDEIANDFPFIWKVVYEKDYKRKAS